MTSPPPAGETPTPRTDAAIGNLWTGANNPVVTPDFARQLERDLAAAQQRAAVEEIKKAIMGGHFLHDAAPAKRFAIEVCAMIDRDISAQPAERQEYKNADAGVYGPEYQGQPAERRKGKERRKENNWAFETERRTYFPLGRRQP